MPGYGNIFSSGLECYGELKLIAKVLRCSWMPLSLDSFGYSNITIYKIALTLICINIAQIIIKKIPNI